LSPPGQSPGGATQWVGGTRVAWVLATPQSGVARTHRFAEHTVLLFYVSRVKKAVFPCFPKNMLRLLSSSLYIEIEKRNLLCFKKN